MGLVGGATRWLCGFCGFRGGGDNRLHYGYLWTLFLRQRERERERESVCVREMYIVPVSFPCPCTGSAQEHGL